MQPNAALQCENVEVRPVAVRPLVAGEPSHWARACRGASVSVARAISGARLWLPGSRHHGQARLV